jgi:hypothetical integral membrane protein (TIGR02206 family)
VESGFQLFGRDHQAILAVTALVALTTHLAVRRTRAQGARWIRWSLAGTLAAAHLSEAAVGLWRGTYRLDMLPFQLCDVAAMLAVYALLSLDRRAIEPLYFFALAGTLPGIITPEIEGGFSDFTFDVYFIEHGLTILAALVLVASMRVHLRSGAWLRAFLLINVLALAVTPINLALGTNFMYLMHKPAGPTPYDWFGPWPGYIAVLEVVVMLIFWSLDAMLPRTESSAVRAEGKRPFRPATTSPVRLDRERHASFTALESR